MKRKIAIYTIVLALLVASAPFFIGYLVQTKFEDVVKVLSEVDSTNIEVIDYQRGWLQSKATTRVTLNNPYLENFTDLLEETPEQPGQAKHRLTALLEHKIYHGPFVMTEELGKRDWQIALAFIRSKLFLNEESKKLLKSEFGKDELLTIQSKMSIEGTVAINIHAEPLALVNAQGQERPFFKGMQANWQLSKNMKELKGEAIFPGIELDDAGQIVSVQDIVIKSNRFKSAEGLWIGKGFLTVGTILIQGHHVPLIRLSKVAIDGEMQGKGNLLEALGNLTIAKIQVGDKQYGPLNIGSIWKNIEAKALKSLIELKQKGSSQLRDQAVEMKKIMGLVMNLLKAQPILRVDPIVLETEQGKIDAQLNITIGGEQYKDNHNIFQIMESFRLNGRVVIPKVLFKELMLSDMVYPYVAPSQTKENQNEAQNHPDNLNALPSDSAQVFEKSKVQIVDEWIAKYLQQGYLMEQDNNYVSDFDFHKGRLMVNGKVMAIPGTMVAPSVPEVPMPFPQGLTQ